MSLSGSIKSLTNDGHTIAQFLVHTMEGQTDGVKIHHRLDAAKQLIKHGFSEEDSQFWGLIPTPEELAAKTPSPSTGEGRNGENNTPSPSTGEGWDGGDNPVKSRVVTYLDILNFDIARQIRDETGEGELLVEFLVKVMNNQQRPYTPKKQRITPADRMAAAKELLRRGFGDFSETRPRLSDKKDDYKTIHADISQRIREFTEYGSDITRFLLDVMSGGLRDEGFTISHRVSAAKEMLRRAYDINFDGVSWEQVEGYWRAQRPIGWTEQDEQKLQAELPTKRKEASTPSPSTDADAPSPSTEEEPAHTSRHSGSSSRHSRSSSRHSRESGNPEAQSADGINAPSPSTTDAAKTPSPSTGEGLDGRGKSPSSMSDETPFVLNASKDETDSNDRNEAANENPFILSMSKDETAINDENNAEKSAYDYTPDNLDPDLDGYYEPLNPEDQAIFDYQIQLESGDFKENEIPDSLRRELIRPSPAAWKEYEDALAHIRQAAAADGVPVLPNPLAGKLRAPTIRGP